MAAVPGDVTGSGRSDGGDGATERRDVQARRPS